MRHLVVALALVLTTTAAQAQTITMYAPEAVGAGLQSDGFSVLLSDGQHGGVFVTLTSSDSTVAYVARDEISVGAGTATQFIPNGTTWMEFVVQGLEGVTGTTTLTASAPGFTDDQDVVDIDAPRFQVLNADTTLTAIDPDAPFYVRFGRPYPGGSWQSTEPLRVGGPGATLTCTVDDPIVAELVTSTQTGSSVTVATFGGQSNSPISVVSGGVALRPLAAGATDLTLSIPGFTEVGGGTYGVDVEAATLSYSGLPTAIGAGLVVTNSAAVILNGTNHGGTTIHLVSADSSRILVATGAYVPGHGSLDIFVPDGENSAAFHVHAMEGSLGIASVVASAPGFVGASDGVEVMTPRMEIRNLADGIDTLDPADEFHVRVGLSNVLSEQVTNAQIVRPGSAGLDVALIVDNPAVGQLETSTGYGDTAWVRIEPTFSTSPSTLVSGGAAFDGVTAGQTLVYPEIAGFVPTAAALHTVTVSQPTLVIQGILAGGIGGGLQMENAFVRLSASAHGGTMVQLAVGDPSLALISGDATVVGAAGVDVFVPDGETIAYFYLQGIEGMLGSVDVTASASGFTPDTTSVDVVAPAMEIQGYGPSNYSLLPSQSEIAYPDEFHAQIGVALGADSVNPQALRPGSAGIDVTVTSDDPLVARFLTSADSASTVSVRIEAGQSSTPLTLAAGGFAFDGIAPGVVNVSVSAPGFTQRGRATRTVTVAQAAFTISTLGSVGAGLVSTGGTVQFNGLNHGGTTVHIETGDPSLALVGPVGPVVGQSSVDIFVPDGQRLAYFDAHGMDDVTGATTLTATAPGFVTNQVALNVVTPYVELQSVSANLDVNDPQNEFQVQVGLPDGSNSYVFYPQARRPGAAPLVATVACSDSSAAEVVTLAGVAGSRQVEIAVGADASPLGVADGGIALRGVGPGTTLVTATIPGFLPTGAATQEVIVTQNGVALLGVPAALGAGLQSEPLVARFNIPLHGGTTLGLTTSDPTAVLISGTATTAGSDTFTVVVPNGQQERVFHLQALEGATPGPLTVTVLADGIVSSTRALDLVAPAAVVTLLPDTLNVNDPDAAFVVQVGVPDAEGAGLAVAQVVRAGAPDLGCPVVLDDGTRADLMTQAATADSVDVVIAPGQSQSAGTVPTGGVALHPLSGGPVIVTARPAGFALVTASSRLVYVDGSLSAARDVPLVTALHGNHPNPFNPVTSIDFSLARASRVQLDVYDVRGRRVRSLVAGQLGPGRHAIAWDGTDDGGRTQATGVYLVRLQTGDLVRTHKMALVK